MEEWLKVGVVLYRLLFMVAVLLGLVMLLNW